MAGNKNPADVFYWNDWDNAPDLRSCSLAAQGLWMRCLCIARRSPEPGFVLVPGKPSGRHDLAEAIASQVGKPPETLSPLIDELISSGTASVDRKGRVYCRRMVRAAALSKKRAVSGEKGADVTNRKRKEKRGLPTENDGKPPDKNDSKPAASSRLQPSALQTSNGAAASPDAARASPQPAAAPPDQLEIDRVGEAACEAARLDTARLAVDLAIVGNWLRVGYDPDREILPAIRGVAARPGYQPPRAGLRYFSGPIADFRATLRAPAPEGYAKVNGGGSGGTSARQLWDGSIYSDQDEWRKTVFDRLDRWRKGHWDEGTYGPKPDQPGNYVPKELLADWKKRRGTP